MTTRKKSRKALEGYGWSPSVVRQYPEKAFDLMVELNSLMEYFFESTYAVTDAQVVAFCEAYCEVPGFEYPDPSRVRAALEATKEV